ncbi:DUF1289 domain-containing protein [Halomonas sp.]|jgi:predicted Fe-S protein YdhL (DUF1289 family)|uniref:DUF1289 domain-containing protein n=1 Tax=Halomonas sp. TaxID=1486246 RepID=UPI00356A94CF
MTKATSHRPSSPCIQLCRIVPASQECEGCGRTLDEIARWGRMTDTEKASVWHRLETTSRVTDA